MILEYWAVRYRPTPMSLTCYGVGIIVNDPVNFELDYRMVSKNSGTVPRELLDANMSEYLKEFFKHAKSLNAHKHPALEYDRPLDARSVLNQAVRNWNNHLEVIGPRKVESESVAAALTLLSETHLGIAERKAKPHKRTEVREALFRKYSERELIKPLMSRNPDLLLPKRLDRRFDLAIVKDQIFELDFTFSFAGEPTPNVQNAADSWSLRLNEIRNGQARIDLESAPVLPVPSDVPIVAAVHPALSPRQKELFQRSTETWSELDVKIVGINSLTAHAIELEKRIAS